MKQRAHMTLGGIATALTLALAAASGLGCSADFAPFNRLTSLRVLAIQSEPASPAPGETATLSALVYTPPGDSNLHYMWKWCPFVGQSETGYRCIFPGPQPIEITDETFPLVLNGLAAQAGLPPPPPPPSLDLGLAPTAQLVHQLDPALLATACAAIPVLNCSDGFPIQFMLTVTTDSEALGTDKVVAVVTGHLRFPDAQSGMLQTANANPTISDLAARIGGALQPITDTPDVVLPRDKETPLELAADEGNVSEVYDGIDDEGAPATGLKERLYVTWFVESGDTDDNRTSFIPDRTPFDDMRKNTWTPALAKKYAATTAQIFVVLHDNRGGVGWRGGSVQLEATP